MTDQSKRKAREVWKPVPEEYGNYEASSFGRLRSQNKVLENRPNQKGYIAVTIRMKSGRSKRIHAHRLIALAFGLITETDIVNHIDGVKDNNRIENLEKSNYRHNNQHAWDTGLQKRFVGQSSPLSKISEIQAREIILKYGNGMTQPDLGEEYGLTDVAIRYIIYGKTWKNLDQYRDEVLFKPQFEALLVNKK